MSFYNEGRRAEEDAADRIEHAKAEAEADIQRKASRLDREIEQYRLRRAVREAARAGVPWSELRSRLGADPTGVTDRQNYMLVSHALAGPRTMTVDGEWSADGGHVSFKSN